MVIDIIKQNVFEAYMILGSSIFKQDLEFEELNALQNSTSGFLSAHNPEQPNYIALTNGFAKKVGFNETKVEVQDIYDSFTLNVLCKEFESDKKTKGTVNEGIVWVLNKLTGKYELFMCFTRKSLNTSFYLLHFPISIKAIRKTHFAQIVAQRDSFIKLDQLTEKEMLVLEAIKMGNKRSEVAEALSMSVHTYDAHRKNIRKKLNVQGYAEMARYFKMID